MCCHIVYYLYVMAYYFSIYIRSSLNFLLTETDMGDRRNAFLMLFNQNEELAIEFLANNMDDVGKYGDGFALLVLDLTRRVCHRDPNQKSRFVRVLLEMLSSNSAAVSYEAAWTLVPSLLLPPLFALRQ